MGLFTRIFGGADGCREAMRDSYIHHVKLARRKGMESPHAIGLYGSLGSRYRVRGLSVIEVVMWPELSPFLLMSEDDAIEALAEYALYQERPYDARQEWLKSKISNVICAITDSSFIEMVQVALINNVAWSELLEPQAFMAIARGSSDKVKLNNNQVTVPETLPTDDANVWLKRGNDYKETGQHDKAIEAYQHALKINAQNAYIWYSLGIAYSENRQFTQAIEAYRQAVVINPQDAVCWNNLGVTYDGMDMFTQAIEAFLQALRFDSQNAVLWNSLGNSYYKIGQFTQSIAAYRKAIQINPNDAFVWNYLGNAYVAMGQGSGALEVYLKLKILNPDLAKEFRLKANLPQ